MTIRFDELQKADFGQRDILRYIADVRNRLSLLSDFPIVSYGPSGPRDNQTAGERRQLMTGIQLKRASTNPAQGLWLAKLAQQVSVNTPIHVLELGTAAGVSGMYLLVGMAQGTGGHFVTFEGSYELAQLAENNLRSLVNKYELGNVTYQVIVGDFGVTFDPYIQTLTNPLHLAFIDGNHREEATLDYHTFVRDVMDRRGIIVHDDIGWSDGMYRAWRTIQGMEGVGRTVELYLGNRPSRGIVDMSSDPVGPAKTMHLDGVFERFGRSAKRLLKRH